MHEFASSSSIELEQFTNNGSGTCAVSYSQSVKSPVKSPGLHTVEFS